MCNNQIIDNKISLKSAKIIIVIIISSKLKIEKKTKFMKIRMLRQPRVCLQSFRDLKKPLK